MSIFDKFAASFPMVSNEDTRWSREGPFLTELANSSGEGKGRVLDLACGSGFHARHLALHGLKITGIDLSSAAIEAGRSLDGGDKVDWVVGDITQPVNGVYDLAIIIGNTLSLLDERALVDGTIAAASSALVPGGALLVHVIDFDFLRSHPVKIEREGMLDGAPVVFEKRIDADESGATISIRVTSMSCGKPSSQTGTQRLQEWGAETLKQSASRSGLRLINEFGGLDRTPRVAGQTRDTVLLFETPH